ncbi:MAG: hypothetical protein CL969_06785 [Euryarchaeota archaeon]|jgi:hypothetical protein|nr:hypothetical protein [Euryarchaeota archaeon]|tara:strand:- start:523 stop:1215 length:693 start_codon:yes stop_codon:yes gene_type:complete
MKNGINLESNPIDVQYLMHKAYANVSLVVENMAQERQLGGDLDPFIQAFKLWGKHLYYHATTEDLYMTGPIKDNQAARDNEAEHATLAGAAQDFSVFLQKGEKAALEASLGPILKFEEEQHQELEKQMLQLEELLKAEVGEDAISLLTRRHIYSRVVALRVCEFDHFANEETFVFPVIRKLMDEQQQLAIAKKLLFDEDSDDRRWIIDWLYDALEPADKKLLEGLEKRMA